MTQRTIIDVVKRMTAIEQDAIDQAATRALSAIEAAGAITFMPAEVMPISGLLMYVHPKVYERVRELSKQSSPSQDADPANVALQMANGDSR